MGYNIICMSIIWAIQYAKLLQGQECRLRTRWQWLNLAKNGDFLIRCGNILNLKGRGPLDFGAEFIKNYSDSKQTHLHFGLSSLFGPEFLHEHF
jgi:hypothetical protein